MGRRRKKDDDLLGPIAAFVVLVFFLAIFSSQVGQALAYLVSVIVIGLIGFGIYRLATGPSRTLTSGLYVPSSHGDPTKRAESLPSEEPRIQNGNDVPRTAAEFLERLRSIDWFQFEKLVALAYGKLDYTVTRRGGANADGGIDLVIEKDGERSAVQCKQWKTWNVGVKSIREFLGALTDAGIQKGIFITLCGYTGGAKRLAEKHSIEILDEVGLAKMLESTFAEFDPETLAILNDTRKFCAKCESEMVLRTATKGTGAGKQFWGCSTYPRCRFIMPVTQIRSLSNDRPLSVSEI